MDNVTKLKPEDDLSVEIDNSSGEMREVVLFGLDFNLSSDNYGSDPKIIIKPTDGVRKYPELLVKMIDKRIRYFDIETNNPEQIDQTISLQSETYSDELKRDISITAYIIPNRYLRADNDNPNRVTVDMPFSLTRKTQLKFMVLPHTKLIMKFS